MSNNPLIVALDVPFKRAKYLVDTLKDEVDTFKVGIKLFTETGPDIVNYIRLQEKSVFLDLKFHDIPNSVAEAIKSAVRLDVQMLTVHLQGGHKMLEAAKKAAEEEADKLNRKVPIILGCGVLSHFDRNDLKEIGINEIAVLHTCRLFGLGMNEIKGLVCSPFLTTQLKHFLYSEFREKLDSFKFVVPGIRNLNEDKDDHEMHCLPEKAMKSGADYIVMGRSIYNSKNPLDAVKDIKKSIKDVKFELTPNGYPSIF